MLYSDNAFTVVLGAAALMTGRGNSPRRWQLYLDYPRQK